MLTTWSPLTESNRRPSPYHLKSSRFSARQGLPADRRQAVTRTLPQPAHLRPLRPSRRQPGGSQCRSMPSQRQLRPAPALPLRPGPGGCMPTSNVHSSGQTTVRPSFPYRPPRARKTALNRHFLTTGKFEPAPLSSPPRKSPVAAQESCRAEGHRRTGRSTESGTQPSECGHHRYARSADVSEFRPCILMQKLASFREQQ